MPLPQSTEKPIKTVIALTEALQAAKERPPRPIWLPVLKDPTPADELVARWRGRPWYVDYGNNPGLSLPVALADYPRGARQEVHCVDLLSRQRVDRGGSAEGGHHCGDDDDHDRGAAVSAGAGAVLLHRRQRPAAGAAWPICRTWRRWSPAPTPEGVDRGDRDGGSDRH